MRNPAMIAIGVLAASVAAWLMLARTPDRPAAPPSVTKAPAAVPAPPVRSDIEAAPSPPAVAEHVNPPAPIAEAPAPPATAPPPPASEQTDEAASAASTSADSESAVEDQHDSDTADESPDEPAGPPELDPDHAADLIADWIAGADTAADANAEGEGHGEIPRDVQAWRTFDKETSNAEWSQSAEQKVAAALEDWLGALPDDVRAHVDVIHVECRATLCQVLAADNDPDTRGDRAQSGQEWQQAIASLQQQGWWSELGFVDAATTVLSRDEDGYTLYQTYLRRAPPPAG